MYIQIYTYIYIYVCVCAFEHTHTYLHTYSPSPFRRGSPVNPIPRASLSAWEPLTFSGIPRVNKDLIKISLCRLFPNTRALLVLGVHVRESLESH